MKNLFAAKSDCGKKELLVSYLYEEATSAERADCEQHLTLCQDCRAELQAFKSVRNELSAWHLPVVPRIEVVTPRTAMDALREFFQLVPGWLKLTSGLASAAAAALILLALTDANLSFGQGGFSLNFGGGDKTKTAADVMPPITPTPVAGNFISRDEAAQMIQTAVAQTKAEAQAQTQLQLANLATKLSAAQQAELQHASLRFRQEYQRKLQSELAKYDNGNRQTLTDWLFASTEQATDSKEATGNEKNN